MQNESFLQFDDNKTNNFIYFVQLCLQKCFKSAIFVGLQASMVCLRVCRSISQKVGGGRPWPKSDFIVPSITESWSGPAAPDHHATTKLFYLVR